MHHVAYTDRMTRLTSALTGICRHNQLCPKIQFESLYEPEGSANTFKDVLPAEHLPERDPAIEKFKEKQESSLMYLSGNKIAVLFRAADKTNCFIIQAELPTERATKRPLTFGDMMLMKTMTHLVWMAM